MTLTQAHNASWKSAGSKVDTGEGGAWEATTYIQQGDHKTTLFSFLRTKSWPKKKNAPRNSVLTNDSCFKVHQSNSLAHCRHYSNRCHVSCTLLSLYRYRIPLNPLATTLAYTTACLLSIRPSQHIITDDIAFNHNALYKLNSVYHSITQTCNFAYSLTWL